MIVFLIALFLFGMVASIDKISNKKLKDFYITEKTNGCFNALEIDSRNNLAYLHIYEGVDVNTYQFKIMQKEKGQVLLKDIQTNVTAKFIINGENLIIEQLTESGIKKAVYYPGNKTDYTNRIKNP
jgi:hypothetical protein